MANNPRSELPVGVIILILATLAAICLTMIAVGPVLLPQILKPVPQAITETLVIPSDTPTPAPTITRLPTDTPTATITPTFTPTWTPDFSGITGPLPDLTVTGISDPTCTPDHLGTTNGVYAKLTIVVRNIGRAPTRSFGSFDVGIFLILGQQRYGLDEWAAKFNGVVGSSNPEISNLNPNADVALKLEIDLKGNTKFGIQASANSGANPIPETDTTNNTLIKYFSMYCY